MLMHNWKITGEKKKNEEVCDCVSILVIPLPRTHHYLEPYLYHRPAL